MGKLRTKTPLHLAQTVAPATDAAISYIPRDGAEVIAEKFTGNFTSTKAGTICLIWNYGAADPNDEEVIDLSNVTGKIPVGTGDAAKKVALVLTNGETVDTIAMSGSVTILEVYDEA